MSEIELKIKSRDLDTLLATIRENDPDANTELVIRAYKLADAAHIGQLRLSGEPYIIHPLEVAIILAKLGLDNATISAALLHDTVEDTVTSLENIELKFNTEIAQLVDGVTKISSLKKRSQHREQAENLRKMLLATINDVRVILIKLADKLHNMRTIMFQPESKQLLIAAEVMDIYAPMAGRLGISTIRSELEDLAFHVLNHKQYHEIRDKVVQRRNELEDYIDTVRNLLQEYFKELNIDVTTTGRAKHYFSIYKKIMGQGKSFDDIFDIRAIRILANEVKECYAILGAIHTNWTPITARFKDFIAVPKSNMYQSLHTTVIGPDGHPLEIQIRTWEMHITSEIGIAAHWLYKENPSKKTKEYKELALFENIKKLKSKKFDTREFMRELKMDLYQEEIYVFTPEGEIIKLAKGATPVDFAYAIHTEVGHHCMGAKVNGIMTPLKSELKSSDIVDILTSKKSHPSESWLKFVKSSNARNKIRGWLRKNGILKGLDEEKKPAKKDTTAKITIPEQELSKISKFTDNKKLYLSIDGTSDIMTKLSQCCQPIPGDKVVGFITRGRGITVHKKSCPSLKRLKIEKERFISIVWEKSENTYPIKFAIEAIDRQNLMKDIIDEISLSKTNIIKLDAQLVEKGTVFFKFILEVKSIEHLKDLIKRIKKIKDVTDAYKMKEKVFLK